MAPVLCRCGLLGSETAATKHSSRRLGNVDVEILRVTEGRGTMGLLLETFLPRSRTVLVLHTDPSQPLHTQVCLPLKDQGSTLGSLEYSTLSRNDESEFIFSSNKVYVMAQNEDKAYSRKGRFAGCACIYSWKHRITLNTLSLCVQLRFRTTNKLSKPRLHSPHDFI